MEDARTQEDEFSREFCEKTQSTLVATIVPNCMELDVMRRATAAEVRKICLERRREDRRCAENKS